MFTIEDLEDIMEKTGGEMKGPNRGTTYCPVHETGDPGTHTPSLDITLKYDRLWVKCWSQHCDFREIFDAFKVTYDLDLNPQEYNMPEDTPEGIKSEYKGLPYLTHWPYTDAEGEDVGYMVRYEAYGGHKEYCLYFKKIRNRIQKINAWFPGGLEDKYPDNRPLYHLYPLMNAEASKAVFITEGEKCADALLDHHYMAVTSLNGSGAAKLTDWMPLKGRKIIIWGDNDISGKIYEDEVCKILFAQDEGADIRRVKVKDLGLALKGDAADWFEDYDACEEGHEEIEDLPLERVTQETSLGVIEYSACEVDRMVNETEDALIKAAPYELFQRGEDVVRVTERKARKSARLKIVDSYYLQRVLSRLIIFKNALSQTMKIPRDLCITYLKSAGTWKLAVMVGLVFAPTLRANGSILDRPGYDKDSGLYLVENDMFLPVPENPTRENALQALKIFDKILVDFNFETPADRAVWLAAAMTSLVRRNFKAPLFGFSAPKKGAGKTLLANLIHTIAIGKPGALMGEGFNEAEMEKQIFAKLREGAPVIILDNINKTINSNIINVITTSESGIFEGRILGLSEMSEVITDVTLLITGNQLSFYGDTTDRVLRCTINPESEKPRSRELFVVPELQKYVEEHRPEIIQALLIAMKAYQVAGSPSQDIPHWGSFETFSKWIRGTLAWLGEADPYETVQAVEEEDPETEWTDEVITNWKELYGQEQEKAAVIVRDCNKALESEAIGQVNINDPAYKLAKALQAATEQRNLLTTKDVGWVLRKMRNGIYSGHKLVRSANKLHGGYYKWRLVGVKAKRPSST